MDDDDLVTAWAPGRVNLMGDHTDHTGGRVLPMAIDLGTTVTGRRGGERVALSSASDDRRADVALEPDADAFAPAAGWARYVAGVVAEVGPVVGFTGTVTTTLPVGAGLSSSAALEVAVALALGADGGPAELATRCQRAEQRASGVPCGIMDQLAATAGVGGHALLIDCHSLDVRPVPLPDGLAVVVVHSGVPRGLAGSAYAERRDECRLAEVVIGPLRLAEPGDERAITDPMLRRRARHVITENARVLALADAFAADDRRAMGPIMAASQASLRDDFAVSVPEVDDLVERLVSVPGVVGARMTGGGFGGCVVALAEPGTLVEGWTVTASGPARLLAR